MFKTGVIYALVAVAAILLLWIVFKVFFGIAAVLFYIAIPLLLLLLVVWLLVRVL